MKSSDKYRSRLFRRWEAHFSPGEGLSEEVESSQQVSREEGSPWEQGLKDQEMMPRILQMDAVRLSVRF
jgi:hypothetical protein